MVHPNIYIALCITYAYLTSFVDITKLFQLLHISFNRIMSIMFFVLTFLKVISSSGSIIDTFDSPSLRVKSILKLLEEYKTHHDWNVVRHETPEVLCGRKFMRYTEWFFRCELTGNYIGGILNNFLVSIIYNRTFLVDELDCYGTLIPRPWVIRVNDMKEILEKAGCLPDFNAVTQPDFKYVRDSNLTIINEPDLFNKAYDVLHPSRTDIPMSAEQRKRANILFSHPIEDVARLESHGFAFIKAMKFTNVTKSLVNPLLNDTIIFQNENDQQTSPHQYPQHKHHVQSSQSHIHSIAHHERKARQTVIIGIHLRHYDGNSHERPEIDSNFDRVALLALDEIHSKIYAKSDEKDSSVEALECLVLVAADRAHSVQAVIAHAERLKCEARIVPKNMSAEPTMKYKDEFYIENGTGPTAVANP